MAIGDFVALEGSELANILRCPEPEAQSILDKTKEAIAAGSIKLDLEEEEDFVSAHAVPSYSGILEKSDGNEEAGDDKFSEAERRLREELAAFKIK
jgi:N utilization substance protein A